MVCRTGVGDVVSTNERLPAFVEGSSEGVRKLGVGKS